MKMHDVFHVSLLKPYHEDGTHQPPPVTILLDGEQEFEVEQVKVLSRPLDRVWA